MKLKTLLCSLLLSSQFINAQVLLPDAAFGSGLGAGATQLNYPTDIKQSADGRIYIADNTNDRISVWTHSGNTFGFLTTFGGTGSGWGQTNYPYGLEIDNNGWIYVSEQLSDRISVWSVSGINYTPIATFGGTGSSLSQLKTPSGISSASNGRIFICDANNHRLSVWTHSGITFGPLTVMGTFGTASNQFRTPNYVQVTTIAGKEKIFVTDLDNSRVCVWVATTTGYRNEAIFGSFGPGNAQFNQVMGIYINPSGNIHVVDFNNRRICLWKETSGVYSEISQNGWIDSNTGNSITFRGIRTLLDGRIVATDIDFNKIRVLKPCLAPSIISSPQSHTVCGNNAIAINISAIGTNLKYSWSNGATTSGFNTTLAGKFIVTITGECGSILKDSAVIVRTNCSFDFDGTDDYIELPYSAALNPSDEFTVMAWVYIGAGSGGTYRSLVTSRDNNGGFVIYAAPDDTWQFWVVDGTSPWAELHSGVGLQYNTWMHIAATYQNGAMKFYANGSLAASANAGAYITNNGSPFRIAAGATEGAANYIMPGQVDDFAYFNKAMPESYIADNFNKKLRGDEKSLLIYYDFEQGIPSGNNAAQTSLINRVNTTFTGSLNNTSLVGNISNFVAKDFQPQMVSTCTPVFITGQSVGQTVCGSSLKTLAVTSSGINLSYAWSNGATTPTISTTISGTYSVSIDGGCMQAVSNAASLLFNPLTKIITQPTNQTICLGTSIGISVSATGTNISYLWSTGSTSTGINTSVSGLYDITVSGTCGVEKSNLISLNVISSTSINTQPVSQTICGDNLAYFTVSATGANLNYFWNTGESNSSISKSVTGTYLVTIVGACGTIVSDASTLLVNPVTQIVVQPLSKVYCSGQLAQIMVSATGTGTLNYLWNNGSTSQAINTSLAGNYIVTVSGDCGTSISNDVTISAGITTNIIAQPVSATVCSGLVHNFTLSALGDNLSYIWNTNETTTSISSTVAGTYMVTVSGICGNVVSNTATLSLLPSTLIATQPQSQTICGSNVATFAVSALGDNLSYMWNSNETTSSISSSVAGDYIVTVSGTCGVEVSNTATLTIDQCTGISQPVMARYEVISIYPNPVSNGEWRIENGELGATMYVFNALGAVVYTQTLTSVSTQVTVKLSSGIYLVKVGTQSVKLVVE